MSCGKNYYEILQVSRKASDKEINRAYRKQAKIWFPDVNRSHSQAKAEEMAKLINRANEILGNVDKRAIYNLDHPNFDYVPPKATPKPPPRSGPIPKTEPLPKKDKAPPKSAPRKGADLYHALNISWVEAIAGGERKIDVKRAENCTRCHGTGLGRASSSSMCSFCGGTGQLKKNSAFMVKIPKGVETGRKIRLKGIGDSGTGGGAPGDLFVEVTVSPYETVPFGDGIKKGKQSCHIYIVSQSAAMSRILQKQSGRTMADAVADILNRHIRELVIKKYAEKAAPDDVTVSILGYGSGPCTGILGRLAGRYTANIQELAGNPIRIEKRKRKVTDVNGETAEETIEFPIWVEPIGKGNAPIYESMVKAAEIASKWRANHPDDNPPVIVTVSAETYPNGDMAKIARKLRSLGCGSGEVILAIIDFSDKLQHEIAFPPSTGTLPDAYAKTLFNMSSPLPERMNSAFRYLGYLTSKGSRAFVYNARLETLILIFAHLML